MSDPPEPSQLSTAFAPAKVNLFLHVGPVRADGFHPLSSLMVFADLGDTLELRPAPALSLHVDGPYAGSAGPDADNLVLRAARALLRNGEGEGAAFRLSKTTPVGAGLGGGSADAAAALRLLAPILAERGMRPDLQAVAAALGSDVPACVWSEPLLAEGRGEILTPAPRIPAVPAVLLHPGVAVSTAQVYRLFDADPKGRADRPDDLSDCAGPGEVAALVRATRNDLEPVALALEPVIGDALALLRAQPQTLVARMSGSGSACFALCATETDAAALAARVSQARPNWWVRACKLGGRPLL